ncbi:Zinc finger, C2H2-like [Penicillium digitatum]|uniref:Zinc finger, C2H2-like n=1 Tax=Penicillium digitatum TaxID=36651 RepID=A0A7T6XFP2_PENDI|nr:Zinc finger, C2H2-like [Penicillium digitatum]
MYDSDDASNRSPPMEAVNPNYGRSETPPPFVSTNEKAPNHPEIAATARISTLEPLPGNLKNYKQPLDFDPRGRSNTFRDDPSRKPSLEFKTNSGSGSGLASINDIGTKPCQKKLTPAPLQPKQPEVEVKHKVQRGRVQSICGLSQRSPQGLLYLRTSSEIKPEFPPLPSLNLIQPLEKSPESSSNKQTLPSIHKAISELSDFCPPVNTLPSPYPFSSCPGSTTSGNDSPFDRTFPGKFSIPPSPFSHFSPVSLKDSSTNPSPASPSSFWRGTPQAEMLSVQTPFEAFPMTAKSPATSYPTPTEQVGVGMGDRHLLAASTPQANGGPVGSYKCTHPGCTAAPFQTQYLLNSHANVHSQDRPHFCPVEGCPRALGGKGFKRKNEMMRHGLVHNSPGYVCPFCPDQQHKYPRPDNLQRHVRVHHVDKNKDDPILRQVLAQRPLGSARGRKRRMNNT